MGEGTGGAIVFKLMIPRIPASAFSLHYGVYPAFQPRYFGHMLGRKYTQHIRTYLDTYVL
jgi:hypothetical protein